MVELRRGVTPGPEALESAEWNSLLALCWVGLGHICNKLAILPLLHLDHQLLLGVWKW